MVTMERALAEAQKNGRVCPQPREWQSLYEMLPNKTRVGGSWNPSLPLILAAWWDTPSSSKALRLREHLEWASAHGCLDAVHSFLAALPERAWHHADE